MTKQSLKQTLINTPIGSLLCVADSFDLYLLEFTDRPDLTKQLKKVQNKSLREIENGETDVTYLLQRELKAYFGGSLEVFQTPLRLIGTPFQQSVWQQLLKIPCGATETYSQLARNLNNPSAARAVGKANGSNQICIIIPCHRLIGTKKSLTGYAGGLDRKQWLLDHERSMMSQVS